MLTAALLCLCALAAPPVKSVTATVETQPVSSTGDSADDPAIWINPADPEKSLILATNKKAGLGVYTLSGEQTQFLADGRLNNVDILSGLTIDAKETDLAAAGSRDDATIRLYTIDPKTQKLSAAASIKTGLVECYGLCCYRSYKSHTSYVFVNDKTGRIEQWRIESDSGKLKGTLARALKLDSQPEGMVADRDLGILYIGEEKTGVWRLDAEPTGGDKKTLVDAAGKGRLTTDVEGLTILYGPSNTGYLMVSSQGSNSYVIYNREPPNRHVGSFNIIDSPAIDGTQDTDGIDITNIPCGPLFPNGFFVAQDGDNPSGHQNFKLVPWESIARAFDPPLSLGR